ncbi:MAG: hypothetical protein MTP17_01360 [Candidatus Midichloria sp.]|nr:MAG: hypothetical protein MTP17_01360 [Candidatus Midichloria sp.]
MEFIAKNQYEFLLYEISYLKPMTFTNIASALGINENNYANKAIKQKIKELVHAENSNNPLSGDKITNILTDQGIQITRRTVAKY